MKFGYWNGYSAGMCHGRDLASDEYERVIAILREELADARLEARNQGARADGACDLLLRHLGARSISLAGIEREQENTRTTALIAERMSLDPTEDQPFGDGTEFKDKEALERGAVFVREPEE